MPDVSNRMRARWAAKAVDAFAKETCMEHEPFQDKLTDLVCDLLHLCDRRKISFRRLLSLARDHYDFEVQAEKGTKR